MGIVMAEPSTSDTQGYLVVTNPDFSIKNVFYWSITPYKASETLNNVAIPSMSIVLNDDSITFTALHTGSARVTLTRVNNSSTQVICMSEQFTTSASYTYTGMNNIEYYCYSGNVGVVDDNLTSSNNYLTVTWGTATSYQEEFDELINELVEIDVALLNLYTRLGTLNGYVDGIESQLHGIGSTVTDMNGNIVDVKDAIDDVYARLGVINTNLITLLNYTDGIEGKLDDVNGNLEHMQTQLKAINTNLITMLNYCDEIEPLLKAINNNIITLLTYTDTLESKLLTIINQLNNLTDMLGKESTDALDDSDITDLGDDEDKVLDDDADLIDDLKLNFGNAFDVVWDLISQAWQSNPKVFTVVIMCLTIGVLKLILNR